MKSSKSIKIFIVLLFIPVVIFAHNFMKTGIKNFILHKLHMQNISLQDIVIKSPLPDYKIYDIKIIKKEVSTGSIKLKLKVINFLNKTDYSVIAVEVKKPAGEFLVTQYNLYQKVRVIYKHGRICISTPGRVIGTEDVNKKIKVKLDSGKIVICKPAGNNTVEVIE